MGNIKWFKNLKDRGYLDASFILLGIALSLSIFMLVGTQLKYYESSPTTNTLHNDTIVIRQFINLDRLDSIEEILYYEVIDSELYLYTKEDSIQDEIERWRYIRSLDPDLWEE